MLNPKIHRLVHNFHIFIIPMTSPELVYNRKSKLTISKMVPDPLRRGSTGTEPPMILKTFEKSVRMDFGMINNRKADPNNPNCFETNAGIVLMQLLMRNTFAAVIDLADGEENQIVYPYGFIPKPEQRILEEEKKGESESGVKEQVKSEKKEKSDSKPQEQVESDKKETIKESKEEEEARMKAFEEIKNIKDEDPEYVQVKNEPEKDTKEENKKDWNEDFKELFENYEEDDEPDESEFSDEEIDPEDDNKDQDANNDEFGVRSIFDDLEEINWDQTDQNWDNISRTINKNYWRAYFNEYNTNEDFFYQKIALILSSIGEDSRHMTKFQQGHSRDFNSKPGHSQKEFNMFIDFAYSGSFNYPNTNFDQCLTAKARIYMQYSSYKLSSFRNFAISIVLKKPNPSLSNENAYGDEQSIRYRLFKTQPQNFTIHSNSRIQREKKKFVNQKQQWVTTGDRFDDGHYGSSSRFIVMFFGFMDIVQPVISIDHISKSDDLKIEYHKRDEDNKTDSKFIKEISGSINMRLRIRGCFGDVEIWDMWDNKLEEHNTFYDKTMNENLLELKVPVSIMNNPFLKHNFTEKTPPNPSFATKIPDHPGSRGNSIPLHLRINEDTNNVLAVKLNLKCGYYEEKIKSLFAHMPQSHFVRSLVDPGYYVVNPWTNKLDFKSPSTVFQINIQDITKIEDSYMIQQKFLSNIDVITDFDLFMKFSDKASVSAVVANDIDNKRVQLDIDGEHMEQAPTFTSAMKLFTYDCKRQLILFQTNIEKLAKNWDLQFKFFGDIGCCTTSTQGKTFMHIHNNSKHPSYIAPPNIFNLATNTGYNGEMMSVDVSDAKKNDPYGLIFYELYGSGVHMHYRGKVPMHSDPLIHSYNRVLEQKTQMTTPVKSPEKAHSDSIRVDIDKIAKAAEYDLNNVFAFGYMVSKSPVTTPFAGLMCSDREKYYLQILPIENPNHADPENDTVGNMLFQIKLYTPHRGEFEIEIERILGSELYFKKKIERDGTNIFEYSSTVNPHMVYSSLNKFVREELEAQATDENKESNENSLEEEYLEDENPKDFSYVNMWSILTGRTVIMRITRDISSNLRMTDMSFRCQLRNKNPVYQEKYALMFKFHEVMNDNSYTSSKFIL